MEQPSANLALIHLIKPHELLYSAKYLSPAYLKQRQDLWVRITKEMNSAFPNNQLTVEECKTKWKSCRKYFSSILRCGRSSEAGTVIAKEMEFLRPFMTKQYVKAPQNVFDADSGSADVIVVDGDSRYEITIEDNDDDHEADDNVGTTNESLTVGVTDAALTTAAAPAVNNTSPDSIEDDSDRTFSNLIVDELRKMTPAAQKEFKRNVTQFLYS